MNVFISWSGKLSKEIAETLSEWIPMVIQAVIPFFSPSDISKGEYWTSEIKDQLKKNVTGIICLTSENKNAPWILFEAGALSNGIGKGKIFPLLFDFEISELKGPLSLFNSTKFNKADFKKLLNSINSDIDNSIDTKILDKLFDKFWPELEEKIGLLITENGNKITQDSKDIRSERDMVEEVLTLQRESIRIISEQKSGETKNMEKNFASLNNSIENLQLRISEISIPDKKYNRRPKIIDAEVHRFKVGEDNWLFIIGLVDLKPIEVFIVKTEDSFSLPSYVKSGSIINVVNYETGRVRSDFQYVDKEGFVVTIGGLSSNRGNPFHEYTTAISNLLSQQTPFPIIEDIIINLSNKDKVFTSLKKQVIKILKKYFS